MQLFSPATFLLQDFRPRGFVGSLSPFARLLSLAAFRLPVFFSGCAETVYFTGPWLLGELQTQKRILQLFLKKGAPRLFLESVDSVGHVRAFNPGSVFVNFVVDMTCGSLG